MFNKIELKVQLADTCMNRVNWFTSANHCRDPYATSMKQVPSPDIGDTFSQQLHYVRCTFSSDTAVEECKPLASNSAHF
jgi:hypothetical protein